MRSWSQLPPRSQRPRGVFLSNSASRRPNSASSFASLRSTWARCLPPPTKWACESYEPRHHAPTREVDDLGLRPHQPLHLLVAADLEDATVPDGDGLGFGVALVNGPDLAVDEHGISRDGRFTTQCQDEVKSDHDEAPGREAGSL